MLFIKKNNEMQLSFYIKYYSLLIIIPVFLLLIFIDTQIEAAGGVESPSEIKNNYESLKIFSEVLSLIETSYVEKVSSQKLIEGAIHGLMKSLDPHTSYMTPDDFKEMKIQTSGKFGGLGIEVSVRDGVLTVISPIEGTPAFEAGVLAKDKIVKIEDESTLDMSLSDAVSLLRGEVGSSVNITIIRDGLKAPLLVNISRDIIKVQSVKKKIFDNNIGYIKIRSFSNNTSSDLDKALSFFRNKNVTKLILDVRNNPGGLLNQAVEVSDRFLGNENLIVYTKGRTEEQNMRFTTHNKTEYVDYPMIILVNGGSASASEIVAGALQDLERAVVLGTPTFGKGSVQTIIPLSDGSAVRLTTARYYTPSGKVIQENGIIPDIFMENKPLPNVSTNDDEKNKKPNNKEKIRKFLRERDLKKHLKGKTSIDGSEINDLNTSNALENETKVTELEKELEIDAQLRHAVSLLSGWDIMASTTKKHYQIDKSSNLSSDKFNR
jgi:carboxyl-terminal processing protease